MLNAREALRFQAVYYLATGVWPLVNRRSFEAVTGPKADWWLVQMVGLLAATIGAAIAVGTREVRPSPALRTLAVLSALSFASIDTLHALRGRISKIYLTDAALELALVLTILGPGR